MAQKAKSQKAKMTKHQKAQRAAARVATKRATIFKARGRMESIARGPI